MSNDSGTAKAKTGRVRLRSTKRRVAKYPVQPELHDVLEFALGPIYLLDPSGN